jgi:hypothetical protein
MLTKINIRTCFNLPILMEQHALKFVSNCFSSNINSYLETSSGQNSNLYLNVVLFFNTRAN